MVNMAKVQISTTVNEKFWREIQEFGNSTKYATENDKLKAAANFGVIIARKLDEYQVRRFHIDDQFVKAKQQLDALINSSDHSPESSEAIREAERQVKSTSNASLQLGDEAFRLMLAVLTRIRNGGMHWDSDGD
jgi:hypothetical protein